MTEQPLHVRAYVVICAILIALTCLTVGVSFMHLAGPWHIAVGMAIALVKASLVVLFFMHALLSPRVTWIVIAVSCFWLMLLFVLTLADYLSRGMLPFMPGH